MIKYGHYHVELPFIVIHDQNGNKDLDIFLVNMDPIRFIFNIVDELKEPEYTFSGGRSHLNLISVLSKGLRSYIYFNKQETEICSLNHFLKQDESTLSIDLIRSVIYNPSITSRQFVAVFECKLNSLYKLDSSESKFNDYKNLEWIVNLIGVNVADMPVDRYPTIRGFGFRFENGVKDLLKCYSNK